MSDKNLNTASKNQATTPAYMGPPVGASPSQNLGSVLPGISPIGSHMPGQASHMGRMEPSHLQELSHSVLNTPNQMSNFIRQRGFLDAGRLLNNAPIYSGVPRGVPQDASNLSNTNLMGNMLGGNPEMSSNTQVLWGTNINTNDLQQRLREFLTTFTIVDDSDRNLNQEAIEDQNMYQEPLYITKLKEIAETEEYTLDVDCSHILEFNKSLYKQLEDYPTDVIPIFDLVAVQVFKEYIQQYNSGDGMQGSNMPDFEQSEQIIQVRPFNLQKIYQIRELDPSHIDKLITLKGIVIRTSDTVPEMKEACFRCTKCQKEEYKFIERGKITEPEICEGCNQRLTFEMIHNFCMFSDKQHIKMQETPETVPDGETPQTLHMCAYEDLVDYVKPGDRVEVVGIFRAVGNRVNAGMRTLKNIYRTHVDVIGYVKTDKLRYDNDNKDLQEANKPQDEDMDNADDELDGGEDQDEGLQNEHDVGFTPAEVQKFKDFSQNPLVYDMLIDALAPSIWENQDVKKGILCQLFGGCSKTFNSSGRGRFRGEINILLCGDPSTAKSQLLQYVHKIAPRGIYTSGKGSSAVGLTVYVTKDPETKEIVLESGALVLSDRGICCIDEFDKMDDNTRVILHEAMEQQTVSVAKAGIICSLNARTAILAAANPVNSKYDPKMSVVDNIRLPPTLLSRFDLIYLVLDKQNESSDRRLANHIVSLYSNLADDQKPVNPGAPTLQSTELLRSNKIDREFFAKYISYARKNITPKITESIQMDLIQEYVQMRSLGNTKRTVTATPRQLESMIRLAEAIAKMRLSQEVEKVDLDEAVRLIKHAIQQAATDPNTGQINMDIITTGVTKTSVERLNAIKEYIITLQREYKNKVQMNGLKYGNLFDFLTQKCKSGAVQGLDKDQEVNEKEFREALRVLEDDNIITLNGHQSHPTIRFVQGSFE